MKELKSKIKKTQVLIKTRKMQLDEEALELSKIRETKMNHLRDLENHQKLYINGVNDLNTERQSGDRRKLSTLERSVDHSKSQWYKSLRTVKTLEEKEKAQIEQVLLAQRNLKSLEKIEESYQVALKQKRLSQEQKELDELSVQRFSKKV